MPIVDTPPTPTLNYFADLSVLVGKPQEVGQTPRGLRRLIPILGGAASGNGWNARVLPGGAASATATAAVQLSGKADCLRFRVSASTSRGGPN